MKIRNYVCADCRAHGEQVGRGPTRKWCPPCQAARESARKKDRVPPRHCPTCREVVTRNGCTYCSAACQPQRTWAERKAGRSLAHCEACSAEYPKYFPAQRWCSLACANRHKVRTVPARRFSPEEARERIRESWRQKNRRRRAAKRGAASEPYTLAEIAARDRMRCGLCGGRVAMKQVVPHPKAPTVDHVVPVFDGGDDTRANVQLAHFLCNSAKGARGSQQLALIG